MDKCAAQPCNEPPYARYIWGGYQPGSKQNNAPLCKRHADELWEKINPLLKVGLAFYAIEDLAPSEDIPKPSRSLDYFKWIIDRGGGIITCGEHLGVYVAEATPENVARCPPGWIFVNVKEVTPEQLAKYADIAYRGRRAWPEPDAKPEEPKKKKK